MRSENRTAWKATLAAIACHISWGFSFLASRTALDSAHVFVLLSHRFLLSFLLMNCVPRLVKAQQWNPKRLPILIVLGLVQPVFYFLGEQIGLLHSNTIFSGVMIAMIPVVTTLAASVFLRERPTAGQLFFSVLSVCGVIGIGMQSGSSGKLDAIGAAALLFAVSSAAAYTLLSRRLSGEIAPFARTYVMMGVGAAAFTVLALLHCGGDPAAYVRPLGEPSYLVSVLFLALFCSVLGFFFSGYAISNLSIARETVFSNLTTVVSVIAGAAILHEPFTWLSAVFCVLILLGIYGVQRAAGKA